MAEAKTILWRWLIAFREVNKEQRLFTSAEIAVLFALATRADADGTGIYNGIRKTAKELRVKDETVTSALAKARGYSVVHREPGKGKSRDNYRLIDPRLWLLPVPGPAPNEHAPY